MAKKEGYGVEAERLYVIEQCGILEIASRLRLGEKTIRNWKAEGNWEEKRAQYLSSRRSFHEELYEFGKELLRSIRDDLRAGVRVDPGRMYMAHALINDVKKVKDYEEVANQKGKDGDKKANPDDVLKTMEQLLGIEPTPANA
jgi:hypothetical protein